MTEENKKPQKVIIRPSKKKTITPITEEEEREREGGIRDTQKPPRPLPEDD